MFERNNFHASVSVSPCGPTRYPLYVEPEAAHLADVYPYRRTPFTMQVYASWRPIADTETAAIVGG